MLSPEKPESETRNWLDLPRKVTWSIFMKLGIAETLTIAQLVCTQWRSICKDPHMWKTIDLRFPGLTRHFEIFSRIAIDRSCGLLIDITLGHLANDDLLLYIADSGCRLRCLRLLCCYAITDEGVNEVAKKLPWLEELDISRCFLSKDALLAIGKCCPLLKSLKFNRADDNYPVYKCDREAFTIAKTMPELRHLELIGNELTDDGLVAILDGCLHLESLDLWHCFNVAFGESLQRKCAEQIKDLRYPSTDDYPTDAENNHAMDLLSRIHWSSAGFLDYGEYDHINIDINFDEEDYYDA